MFLERCTCSDIEPSPDVFHFEQVFAHCQEIPTIVGKRLGPEITVQNLFALQILPIIAILRS
jgi:hypothetical protein